MDWILGLVGHMYSFYLFRKLFVFTLLRYLQLYICFLEK